MANRGIAGRYLWLVLFGVAFGFMEGAVVVYLRAIYYPDGFEFPVAIIPDQLIRVEIVREAASLIMLAAIARLAGTHFLERFGAFMFLFGVWDLVYYATLRVVLGWPSTLADWDILFLIPVPWVAPVWAPVIVSIAFTAIGTRLYCTGDRARDFGMRDWTIEIAAGAIVLASFLMQAGRVARGEMPVEYPTWLFWTGLLLGVGWFVYRERAPRSARVGFV
ncbi:MAG TPA: hypothetical protein VMT00_16115 [Thermoanaerobaculia bacterium]|nr:hypothetical protein [Thermoanaerobaculia bacterium]